MQRSSSWTRCALLATLALAGPVFAVPPANAPARTAPAPGGRGALSCMEIALAASGIDAGAIAQVNAHGTSTPLNDAAEAEAMAKLFGTPGPPVTSIKGVTRHSLGPAGVQEAIYSLLMMNNGFICESAHITELDPVFADMPIVRKRIDNAKLGTVLSNSFGFGGTNATLVFKRMDA